MFRIVYSVLLPFLAPFVCHRLWRACFAKNAERPYPARALFATGLICVLAYLCVFSDSGKASADSVYTPPKFENGRIVPAHMDEIPHAP